MGMQGMTWLKIAIAWAFAAAVIVAWLRAATENEARRQAEMRRRIADRRQS